LNVGSNRRETWITSHVVAVAGFCEDCPGIGDGGVELLSVLELAVDAAGGGQPVVHIFDKDQGALLGPAGCDVGHRFCPLSEKNS
jgi:hypothetical protein